jgi:hypothetical protein
MSIEELGMSLLARKDEQHADSRRREREQEKRARREQLLSTAGGIAVNIGNKVLARKAETFMDKEFDMASRAKYKLAYAEGEEHQKLHGSMRDEGYNNASAWRYDQLEAVVREQYSATKGPNWDGVIPPEALAGMRQEAQTWGADFDAKYEESFKLQDFKTYKASVQKRYGRPTSIEDWAVRGVTNMFDGQTKQEGRADRAEALRAEIDNFDTDYKHLYDHTVQRTGNAAYAAKLVQDHANVSYRKFSNKAPIIKGGHIWRYSIDTETGEEKLVIGEKVPMGATMVGSAEGGHWMVGQDKDGNTVKKLIIPPIARAKTTTEINHNRRDQVSELFANDEIYKGEPPDVQYALLYENNPRLFYDALNAGHKALIGAHATGYTEKAIKYFGGDTALREGVQGNLTKIAKNNISPAMASAMQAAYTDVNGVVDKEAVAKGLDMVATLSSPDYQISEDSDIFYRMIAEDVVQARAKNPKDASDNPITTDVLIANAIAERSKGLVYQTGEREWLGLKGGKQMVVYGNLYQPGSEASQRLESQQQLNNSEWEGRAGTMEELKGDALTDFNKEFKEMQVSMSQEEVIAHLEQMKKDAKEQNYKGFQLPVVAKQYLENYEKEQKKEEVYVAMEEGAVAAAQLFDPDLTPKEALEKYPSSDARKSLSTKVYDELLIINSGMPSRHQKFKKFEDEDDFGSWAGRWWKKARAGGRMDDRELDVFKQSIEPSEEYLNIRDFALSLFSPYDTGLESINTYAQYFRDNLQDLPQIMDLDWDMNAFVTKKYLEAKEGD